MNIKILQDTEAFSYKKETKKRNYKGEIITELYVISNFIIIPLYTVECKDIVYYHSILTLVKDNIKISKNIIFSSTDFITIKSFKKRLSENDFGVFFIGTDSDLSIIQKIVSDSSPKKLIGIDYLGLINNDGKWEYVDKTTKNEKFIVREDVFIDYSIGEELTNDEDMKILYENLFSFNSEEIVFPVLCSITNCFLHSRLKNLGIKTPIINFCGEAGSAKSSTLENIVSPFFGEIIADSASKLKEFASLRIESESNLFPHFIEEYKENNMTKYRIDLISSIIRSIYDGHSIKRGNSDQSITNYILKSPLFLIGETGFVETAVKERLLLIMFSKRTLNIENKKCFFELKKNRNLLKKIGNLLLAETLKIDDAFLFGKFMTYGKILENDDIPERIKNNIVVSSLSYELLKNAFSKYNIQIKENIIDIIRNSQTKFNLDFQSKNKSMLENTLEIISTMMEREVLIKDQDFYISENELVLKARQVYHKLTKYMNDHKLFDEICIRESDFRNQIKNTDFYINRENKKIYGKSVRGIFLDLTKMIHLDFCLSNDLDPKTFIKSVDMNEKQYIKSEQEGKQIDLNEFNFQ